MNDTAGMMRYNTSNTASQYQRNFITGYDVFSFINQVLHPRHQPSVISQLGVISNDGIMSCH